MENTPASKSKLLDLRARDHEKRREEAIKKLDSLLAKVLKHKRAFLPLDKRALSEIQLIDVLEKDSEAIGSPFFLPLPAYELDEYPIDWELSTDSRRTKSAFEQGPLTTFEVAKVEDDWLWFRQAEFYNSHAVRQYSSAPRRMHTDEGVQHKPLKSLVKNWVKCDYTEIFHKCYWDILHYHEDPCWRVRGSWRARGKTPHIMVHVNHGVKPGDEFLRAEVLTIIAAMRTSLWEHEMRKALVVPVLLFSNLGDHSRILQAHFDGKDLIIKKSPLVSFKSQRAFDRICQYLGSKPVGNTTTLASEKNVGK